MDSNLFPSSIDESPMYHTVLGRIETAYDKTIQGKPFVLAVHEGSFNTVTGEVDERVNVFDTGDIDLDKLEGCILKISKNFYGIMGGRWVLETDSLVRVDDGLVSAYEDL